MAEKEATVRDLIEECCSKTQHLSLLITSAPCCSNQNHLIYDETSGALLLQTESAATCFVQILCDAEERPIITLHKKGKWKAYRYSGKGIIDPVRRLFTIKSLGFFSQSLHIFKAPKTHKDELDFRAKQSGSKVVVFRGRTDHMVAKMERKRWFSNDRCVWVESGTNYAVICAIMVAILKGRGHKFIIKVFINLFICAIMVAILKGTIDGGGGHKFIRKS